MKMNFTIPYDEFRIWKQLIAPKIIGLNEVAEEIIEYALTEILNNAQDHSDGKNVTVLISQYESHVKVTIGDDGIGIFKHIMDHLHLDQELDAAIELIKGKFTTSPKYHSGEGLFFTSNAVEKLTICANRHCLELATSEVTFNTVEEISGTNITVYLKKIMNRSLNSVFEDYCHVDKNEIPVFDRTVFRLQLVQSEGRLISRSQAKRVMNGMERFSIVEVDFTGVDNIGQAFADEMFRVWQSFHQETIIKPTNTSDKIKKIISRVTLK
jgi:anti-sigma regulatory factor (Ser/Thr protein kinase)